MNYWTKLSIEYANQRSYLDDLFQVYPTIPEGIRDIDKGIWGNVEKAFEQKNNLELLSNLLKLDLFTRQNTSGLCPGDVIASRDPAKREMAGNQTFPTAERQRSGRNTSWAMPRGSLLNVYGRYNVSQIG